MVGVSRLYYYEALENVFQTRNLHSAERARIRKALSAKRLSSMTAREFIEALALEIMESESRALG